MGSNCLGSSGSRSRTPSLAVCGDPPRPVSATHEKHLTVFKRGSMTKTWQFSTCQSKSSRPRMVTQFSNHDLLITEIRLKRNKKASSSGCCCELVWAQTSSVVVAVCCFLVKAGGKDRSLSAEKTPEPKRPARVQRSNGGALWKPIAIQQITRRLLEAIRAGPECQSPSTGVATTRVALGKGSPADEMRPASTSSQECTRISGRARLCTTTPSANKRRTLDPWIMLQIYSSTKGLV